MLVKLLRLVLLVVISAAWARGTLAQETPVLRIYTYDSFAAEWGPGPALKSGFEAICSCEVEFVAAESAISALRRIQLEGSATSADILLGLDTATAGEARATAMFAKHGISAADLDLPVAWTDEEFLPFDYGYFAFVYDRDKVVSPPGSFEELIARPGRFKVVIEDPRSDTPGLGLVLWIRALYGDRAPEIWRGLKPHILTMTRGWSEAYALFLKGEADMVLSYTTSPAYHVETEGDASIVAADFGAHYAQIEIAGVLAASKNKDLATRFLAYLISPEGQAAIPTTNWMYPVARGTPVPPSFAKLIEPDRVLLSDPETVTANRSMWIEEALAAIR